MIFKHFIIFFMALVLTGCFGGNDDRVAATAKFYEIKNGKQVGDDWQWVAFKPSAVAHLKDEKIEIGGFKLQKHKNICVWRDHTIFKPKDEPIKSIILSCIFKYDLKKIQRLNKSFDIIEYASFQLIWEQVNGQLFIDRYDITVMSEEYQFSSRGNLEELKELKFHNIDIKLPEKHSDIISFDVDVTAPYRLNSGENAKDQQIRMHVKGLAEPMPDWVVY